MIIKKDTNIECSKYMKWDYDNNNNILNNERKKEKVVAINIINMLEGLWGKKKRKSGWGGSL